MTVPAMFWAFKNSGLFVIVQERRCNYDQPRLNLVRENSVMANSADQDQTVPKEQSYLSLCCLLVQLPLLAALLHDRTFLFEF